jgi:hypothetical protein
LYPGTIQEAMENAHFSIFQEAQEAQPGKTEKTTSMAAES